MNAILTFLSGVSVEAWARIGAIAAILLGLWLAYGWAYDRGAVAQKADDQIVIDQKQARIEILAGDVLTLQAGIEARNQQIEANAAKAREDAAAAARKASDALAALDAARKREAARGVGADAMNDAFQDLFGRRE